MLAPLAHRAAVVGSSARLHATTARPHEYRIGVVAYIAHDIDVMNKGRVEESGPAGRAPSNRQSGCTRALLTPMLRLAHSGSER